MSEKTVPTSSAGHLSPSLESVRRCIAQKVRRHGPMVLPPAWWAGLRHLGKSRQRASIRGYAQQLATEAPDRRLGIITEQVDRLSRMVRQLLTVSRIQSGALRPRLEVFSIGARVRRTWEALGAAEVPFSVEDGSQGWLALADPDQVDQVLWAILDNAIDHGGRTAIDVTISLDAPAGDLAVTIADHGPGVPAGDRDRLFQRFERGAQRPTGEGSGLGLYVSRELCRAMSGDLVLEPAGSADGGGRGAAFTVHLPAEAPEET